MNKILVGVVIGLIVLIGAFFIFAGGADVDSNVDEHEASGDDAHAGASEGAGGSTNIDEGTDTSGMEVKTFMVEGVNFDFLMDGVENPDIVVNEGDLVRIEFTSADGFHDWVVDEFNAATQQVNTGGKTSVEFIADKKGTFEYYCSVGQHRANGMVGNLIVQ